MHIRFPTEAANADSMRGDAPGDDAAGNKPAQSGRTDDLAAAAKSKADAESGEAKPGKDVNAPGFLRDKDAGKP